MQLIKVNRSQICSRNQGISNLVKIFQATIAQRRKSLPTSPPIPIQLRCKLVINNYVEVHMKNLHIVHSLEFSDNDVMVRSHLFATETSEVSLSSCYLKKQACFTFTEIRKVTLLLTKLQTVTTVHYMLIVTCLYSTYQLRVIPISNPILLSTSKYSMDSFYMCKLLIPFNQIIGTAVAKIITNTIIVLATLYDCARI